jgi:ABC-type amino acid transport system permease subunit
MRLQPGLGALPRFPATRFSTGSSHALAIYVAVAALFFAISFPLTRLAILLERRLIV